LKNLKQLPSQAHTKVACKLRASKVYGKYITQQQDRRLKLEKSVIEREERYDGKYLIRTSDDTLSSEDGALGYKQLVDVDTYVSPQGRKDKNAYLPLLACSSSS
jgi:hypothetical protein